MIKPLKLYFKKIFPDLYHALASLKFFAFCWKKLGRFQDAFKKQVYADEQITVLTGPFQGLRYYNRIIWGPITPKWVGSYEQELHGIIEGIITRHYSTIIDVGAAEGYYAVGLAAACEDSSVITFDIDPIARRRQRQLIDLNGLTNVEIRKYCTPR